METTHDPAKLANPMLPPTHHGRCYVESKSIIGTVPTGHPPKPIHILIADDDAVSLKVLERSLIGWGYSVLCCRDGEEAWEILQREDCPKLALLDWMMPGIEGPELCRRTRALARPIPTYVILLTAKTASDNIVAGLESGADDYIVKPFDRAELRSRLRVGERVVELQRGLFERVQELELALGEVKQLSGLLPICAYCKSVRDDQNYWQRVETYITANSNARFSHGICPTCLDQEVEKSAMDISED
jgi:sigma-B regulation protein RsbU (phosphoserine phosphatase)